MLESPLRYGQPSGPINSRRIVCLPGVQPVNTTCSHRSIHCISSSSTIYRTRQSPPSPFSFAFASEKSITTSSPSRNVLPFGRLKISNGLFGSTCLFASSGFAGSCCDALVSTRNICRGGGETNVVAVVCTLSLFEAHAADISANRTISPSRFLTLLIHLQHTL